MTNDSISSGAMPWPSGENRHGRCRVVGKTSTGMSRAVRGPRGESAEKASTIQWCSTDQ